MRYPASGAPLARLRELVAAEREAPGVPEDSKSATRVSARSTLTSTCFFNLIQSFGIVCRVPRGRRPEENPRRLHSWRSGVIGGHWCLVSIRNSAARVSAIAEEESRSCRDG